MDRIFNDAKDKNVAACKIYTKTGDTFAYVDSECKTKFGAADLQDAYVKGAVIIVGTVMYRPVSASVSNDVVTLTYVTADKTTATTAVLATVKSE